MRKSRCYQLQTCLRINRSSRFRSLKCWIAKENQAALEINSNILFKSHKWTLNSENIFDQNLSIWRLLLLNSSSSWDFCWMQSTHNENDSAGILSLSLSLFWFFLCDSLSLFDMNMFPFTFWARFSETVSLSILNQKNFYRCFLSVSLSCSQNALFLFLVHKKLISVQPPTSKESNS